jgi:histidine triad (HIT) family protein
MHTDPDCIFCKIVAGEIPCLKLWEDDTSLAFMDINPANPGHALSIVKEHHATLYETPAALLAGAIGTAKRVATAVRDVVAPHGINIVQANGPGAGQSVFHLHFHILPRLDGDEMKLNWGHTPGDMDAVKALHEKLVKALG